jgi:SAM-dependent methyltransferase
MFLNWFEDLESCLAACESIKPADDLAIEFLRDREEISGFCSACLRPVQFQVSPEPIGGSWRNFLEGLICSCGTNGRTRMIMAAWREIFASHRPARSLIFERVTPTFDKMVAEDSALLGCEFLGPDKTPGEQYEFGGIKVRHDDLLNLSAQNASLDLVMHFDVLEHVPDHRRAIGECYPALRPGGQMLFTLPFYDALEKHIVRARMADDGIEHLLPPAFHGNPVGDGALVFIQPGQELMVDLAAAGFETRIGLAHSLGCGIISNGCPWPEGHMWPLIFLATKPDDQP